MEDLVSKSSFKAHALEIFRQVETARNPVIITDHGKPAREVRPCTTPARPPLAILRGSVLRYDRPADPVADDDWEAGQ